MQLDGWVRIFVAAGPFRLRCRLCGRELYGQSRRKHMRVVHEALITARLVVYSRGQQWSMLAVLDNTQPRKRKR